MVEGLKLEDLPNISEDADLDEYELKTTLSDIYGPFDYDPLFYNRLTNTKSKERLSGQYNRLFPVKLVLRTLANLIASRQEYSILGQEEGAYDYDEVLLEDLREECLKVARYAKSRFEWIDARSGEKHGRKTFCRITRPQR